MKYLQLFRVFKLQKPIVFISLILFIFLSAYKVNAEIRPDHKKHLAATASISAATYSILRHNKYSKLESLFFAFALTNIVSHIKEINDPFVDSSDVKFNAIGSLVGPLFMISLDY